MKSDKEIESLIRAMSKNIQEIKDSMDRDLDRSNRIFNAFIYVSALVIIVTVTLETLSI